MFWNMAPLLMAMGFLMKTGSDVADFSNNVLNNMVTVSSDSHQARMAQDIFRQEVRYAWSLQIREDIRDQRKVMLESATSYLYFGSMILGACLTSLIEGFPPLNTSRMTMLWWLFFGVWGVAFNFMSMWYALCFQVKLSQSARERLLLRYRYRLADDHVVNRLGGMTLYNTYKNLFGQVGKMFSHEEIDDPVPEEKIPENLLSVKVMNLTANAQFDITVLAKQMNGWTHESGSGYAKPLIIDAPYYMLNETLIRTTWVFSGSQPLIFRVGGETTLYIAAQCPPLGGGLKENQLSVNGSLKGLGAAIPEWPVEELPVVTAGFHPAWRGESGYGEFRRVDGASIFIDADTLEIPVYKIVLAAPLDGPDGYVDVVICWQFQSHCEGLCIVLRKGAVHCNEEDWPMAEFNAEICQIMPLQEYSSTYMRRGAICLLVNICLAVLCRFWLIGDRPAWWLESLLMCIVFTPACLTMYTVPLKIADSTLDSLSMAALNRSKDVVTRISIASNDIAEQEVQDRLAVMEDSHKEPQVRFQALTTSPTSSVTLADDRGHDSPPKVPRRSDGRVGGDQAASTDSDILWPSPPSTTLRAVGEESLPPLDSNGFLSGCCEVAAPAARSREVLSTAPSAQASKSACPVLCGAPSQSKPQQLQSGSSGASDKSHIAPNVQSRAPMNMEQLARLATLEHESKANLQHQRWLQWLPDRFRHACLYTLVSYFSGSPMPPEQDTPLLRLLHRTTRLLDCTFILTVILVMSAPGIEWYSAPITLGETPGYPERRLEQSGPLAFEWAEVPVSWPPFLHPTAAVLDESSNRLHVASSNVLWTFRRKVHAMALDVVGNPLVLPEAVRGLGFSGQTLVAISDTAAYKFDRAQLGVGSAAAHAGPSLLDLVSIASLSGPSPLPAWTHGLGPVSAAAIVEVPSNGSSSMAMIIASRSSSVKFCAPSSDIAGGPIKVLAGLDHAGKVLDNISGMHVASASETVLWAGNRKGIISALGLSTGRLLGTFDALLGIRSEARQKLRGHAHLSNISRILVLAGNSTHLFMLAEAERAGRQRLALFCAPYPAIDKDGSSGAEL